MTSTQLRTIMIAGWTVGTSACTDGTFCTTSIEPAVVVEIRDSIDDTPIAAGASGRVVDGGFTDSLRAYASLSPGMLLSRAGADERPGEYLVQVEHPGYNDWTESGVRVETNACHVSTVTLQARLQRVP
jgi:hypothetical protein